MGSKKKHRNRNDEMFYNENMNNNPFGIDPNALMSMLGNIDQNKLNNIMSSLNQNGINMDNLNFDSNNNDGNRNNNFSENNEFDENNNQMNNNQMNNMFNGMGNINPLVLLNNLMNQQQGNNVEENNMNEKSFKDMDNKIKNNTNEENNTRKRRDINPDDPNIEMLLALKKIVNDEERSNFIDKTIYLYLNGAYEGVKKNE
ncbi:hypothetical protein [uncultured Clostridium sp.]|uniref:hypothetical protein n=1 Tax=uncultured Clostridium sp. TaxID=59620 RepID=UPI002620437C|nr:hypothetical protein [uncultured Clostridium sp.]